LSVTCHKSVVFSGYFGFLHQKNWQPRLTEILQIVVNPYTIRLRTSRSKVKFHKTMNTIMFFVDLMHRLWMQRKYQNNFKNLSVTCHKSVVFSGYFGFLHQKNWQPRLTEILLKVALNTIKQTNHRDVYEHAMRKRC
jgi:hypothetical protein